MDDSPSEEDDDDDMVDSDGDSPTPPPSVNLHAPSSVLVPPSAGAPTRLFHPPMQVYLLPSYVRIYRITGYLCDLEICAFWPKKEFMRGSTWGVAIHS